MTQVNRFSSVLRLSVPAVVVACALFLPFLNKAFLIDDPYFLMQAEQIRHQFLRPVNFTMCWYDTSVCAPISQLAPGGALMGYYLLPAVQFGALEPIAHSLQLLALLAAITATVSLALRLGAAPAEARFAGLLLVTFPPVLALTDTAMPDVLAMSLGVVGIERFTAWLENGRIGSATAAALALGLAPFARVHAVGLMAVAAVAAMEPLWSGNKAHVRWANLSPLLAAMAIFLIISHVTGEPGSTGALPPQRSIMWDRFAPNLRSLFWGYVICFPISLLWLVSVRRRAAWLALYASCVFLICLGVVKISAPQAAQWAMAAIAALCIAQMLWRGARTGSPGLHLGIWLLVPCVILPYIHLPAKYLVLSSPAAAIAGVALFATNHADFDCACWEPLLAYAGWHRC